MLLLNLQMTILAMLLLCLLPLMDPVIILRFPIMEQRILLYLIRTANLQLAAVLSVQMIKIVGLQQHVRKLCVRNAVFAILQPCAHAFLSHHVIDSKMLTHIAQEMHVAKLADPIVVVHHTRGIRAA